MCIHGHYQITMVNTILWHIFLDCYNINDRDRWCDDNVLGKHDDLAMFSFLNFGSGFHSILDSRDQYISKVVSSQCTNGALCSQFGILGTGAIKRFWNFSAFNFFFLTLRRVPF